jgi:hypothetical protein
VDFDVTNYGSDILYSSDNGQKMTVQSDSTRYLYIYKRAYNLMRTQVLYSIQTEFGISIKLVWLLKMCSNGTYSKIHIGKNLSGAFRIQTGLIQGNAFQLWCRICYQGGIRKRWRDGIKWNAPVPGLC